MIKNLFKQTNKQKTPSRKPFTLPRVEQRKEQIENRFEMPKCFIVYWLALPYLTKRSEVNTGIKILVWDLKMIPWHLADKYWSNFL